MMNGAPSIVGLVNASGDDATAAMCVSPRMRLGRMGKLGQGLGDGPNPAHARNFG